MLSFNQNGISKGTFRKMESLVNAKTDEDKKKVYANTSLPHEAWIDFDKTLVTIARPRLVGIGDLISAGLSRKLPSLGTTIAKYTKISDLTDASVSMNGKSKSSDDRQTFTEAGVPVPIIHKDFSISDRSLLASANYGEPLDTSAIAASTAIVAEKNEYILFNGYSGLLVDGLSLQGYTNFTNRNTGSIGDWTNATLASRTVVDDVIEMIAALQGDNFYGPYTLYVPKNFWPYLFQNMSLSLNMSFYEFITKMPDIAAVRPATQLTNSQCVMVQLTSDVIDLPMASNIQVIEDEAPVDMETKFKVFSAMVPRIKSDKDGRCGVAHWS